MSAKPASTTRWAQTTGGVVITGPNAPVTPNSGKLDAGLAPGEKPPSGFLNWILNILSLWSVYVADADFVAGGAGAYSFGIRGTAAFGGDGVVGIGANIGNGTATNGGNFTGGNDTGGTTGAGGAGVVAQGGTSASTSSTGGDGGKFTAGTGTAGQTPGIGVYGVGSTAGTTYGFGGHFTGSGATRLLPTSSFGGWIGSDLRGAGMVGVGALDATLGGPGVAAIADHPGGTSVRAALFVGPQQTPSVLKTGDIWFDATNSASTAPKVSVSSSTAVAVWLSKYLAFSGLPGAVASTTYVLAAAANSTVTQTTGGLGNSQYVAPARVALSLGIKTSTTTAGGTITVQLFFNGSQIGVSITLNAGTVAGVYTTTFNQNVAANGTWEVRVVNGSGVSTGVGQCVAYVEVC